RHPALARQEARQQRSTQQADLGPADFGARRPPCEAELEVGDVAAPSPAPLSSGTRRPGRRADRGTARRDGAPFPRGGNEGRRVSLVGSAGGTALPASLP